MQVCIPSLNTSNFLCANTYITFGLMSPTLNTALGLFLFLYPFFSLLSSFHFVLYIRALFPFLVSGIRELRVPSKCQGSQVKHMQHVLQFITPHLPWDFALLTSLSKSCLLFWNGDRTATGAGLPATHRIGLAAALEVVTIPEGTGLSATDTASQAQQKGRYL